MVQNTDTETWTDIDLAELDERAPETMRCVAAELAAASELAWDGDSISVRGAQS